MVEPIQHDTSSALATAGRGAGFGAIKGIGTVVAAGAVIGGAFGSIASYAIPTALAWVGLGTLGAMAVGAGIGAVAAGWTAAPLAALIFGLIGAADGGRQANLESGEFARLKDHVKGTQDNKLVKARTDEGIREYAHGINDGAQIGYQKGFQEGGNYVAQQFMAQNAPQAGDMAPPAPPVPGAPAGAAAGGLTMAAADKNTAAAGTVTGATAVSPDGKSFASTVCKCDTMAGMIEQQRKDKAAAVPQP